MKKIETGTLTRTIVLVLALINQGLVIAGKNTLPFSDAEMTQFISFVFTTGATLTAWWKNNDFTHEAKTATKIMQNQKLANKQGDQLEQAKASNQLNLDNQAKGINTDETFG
ncbi:phage lysis protein, holin [Streptococcus pseudoporcinus]|uniref:Phage lysis protein, holin n=1 Tax=Streptococcus pseudoporcinus TaxID=361101 RepID=A0A4U9XP34_9STRE|nr:phage holin [Streptococcus pseudoporcinus]QBX18738.1 holin [Streptococcus phage Javan443]QBX18743.1 holin [Streptococcus phage Javan445]VTS13525.1 phage lysis protein, holin [Streptococcus pseudoporcinus]VTS14221.1 phage lysis protein, holin [Streptococcus pseudoporcinus]VTS20252.1 phage lysis protein, holin [Streptococcus pseudoporcinus]